MKNLNIFGVDWKIWLLGGFIKTNIEGGLSKKGGLGQFANLMGKGGGKKEGGGVFEGGWYPNAHFELPYF